MIVYIIFYIIIFLLSFKIQKKKWDVYDILFLGIIILFSGLRYGIGSDYILYESSYQLGTSIENALQSRTGIGYTLLTYFFNTKLNLNYQAWIFIVSFCTNFLIYSFMKKHSERPGLVMLIYIALGFYAFSLNGFRQSIATMFVIYGLNYLQRKKKIKCLIFYLIGFSIHSISLLSILVFSFLYLKPKLKIRPLYVLIISLIGFILYDFLYLKIVGGMDAYQMYYDTANEYKSGVGTYLNVLFYIVIYTFIMITNMKKIEDYNGNNNLYFKIATIGIIINIFSIKNWLFNRVALQFLIFITFILASYYEIQDFRKKRLESLIFYTVIFIYYIMNVVSFNGILPYQSVIF